MVNISIIPMFGGRWPCLLLKLALVFVLLTFCSSDLSFASSDGGHGGKGWMATDTYRVFNFTVLAVGLFLVARKPVKAALGKRINDIRDEIEGLEERKKNVEAELSKSNERLAELEGKAKSLLDEYVEQGESAKVEILAEAEASAEKLRKQARKSVEDEFLKAKLKLRCEIVEKAIAEAERIIKERITSEDQEKLVDEYLDKVVA